MYRAAIQDSAVQGSWLDRLHMEYRCVRAQQFWDIAWALRRKKKRRIYRHKFAVERVSLFIIMPVQSNCIHVGHARHTKNHVFTQPTIGSSESTAFNYLNWAFNQQKWCYQFPYVWFCISKSAVSGRQLLLHSPCQRATQTSNLTSSSSALCVHLIAHHMIGPLCRAASSPPRCRCHHHQYQQLM